MVNREARLQADYDGSSGKVELRMDWLVDDVDVAFFDRPFFLLFLTNRDVRFSLSVVFFFRLFITFFPCFSYSQFFVLAPSLLPNLSWLVSFFFMSFVVSLVVFAHGVFVSVVLIACAHATGNIEEESINTELGCTGYSCQSREVGLL